jgi:hypothetical protein
VSEFANSQEDELTLIIAGGVLGAVAGWIQMHINGPGNNNKKQNNDGLEMKQST